MILQALGLHGYSKLGLEAGIQLASPGFNVERPDGLDWRKFFDGLDKRWEQPAIRQRLSRMIEVPPEFTEVVYVYRNAADPGKMEWKELLLSDFGARFDGIPLKECLATRCFDDIFRPYYGELRTSR